MNIIYDINRSNQIVYLITVDKNQLCYKKLMVDNSFTRIQRCPIRELLIAKTPIKMIITENVKNDDVSELF